MSMFGGNVHIIGSPDLVYSLQRQPRSLSFYFFEGTFTAKFGGMTKKNEDAILRGIEPDSKDDSPVLDGLKYTKFAVSPQGGMPDMVRIATTTILSQLNQLQKERRVKVDLWDWIRHEVSVATTDAVYGPANPYRDPKFEAAFW